MPRVGEHVVKELGREVGDTNGAADLGVNEGFLVACKLGMQTREEKSWDRQEIRTIACHVSIIGTLARETTE